MSDTSKLGGVFELFAEEEPAPALAPAPRARRASRKASRDRDGERGQLGLVLEALRACPGSTATELRASIAREHGVEVERVQARLGELERDYYVDRDGDRARVRYTLGPPRATPRGQREIRVALGGEVDAGTAKGLRLHLEATAVEWLKMRR